MLWRNSCRTIAHRPPRGRAPDGARYAGLPRGALAALPGPARGARSSACGRLEALPGGASGGDLRGARLLRDGLRLVPGRGKRRRRVGARVGPPILRRARRARRPLRPARYGDRIPGLRLLLALPAFTPRARGASGVRGDQVLRLHAPLYGLDGRARDGPGPRAVVRLLGSYGDRVLLPDRLRPPRPGRPRLGADGAPRHGRDRRLVPRRCLNALRGPRDRSGARARRKGIAGPAPEHCRHPNRHSWLGQERSGSAALLAATGDGGTHPSLGLPPLRRDGCGRGVAARPGLPPLAEEPTSPRRTAHRRAALDRRRRRSGPYAGRPQATPGLLHDLPVRLRRLYVWARRKVRRRGWCVLRNRTRP